MTQHGAYERWSEVIVYFRWLHLFCRECQLEIKKANRQWFFYSFFLLLQCWHSRRGRKGWKQRKPTKSESLLHLNVIPSYVCPVFQDTRTWTSILSAVLNQSRLFVALWCICCCSDIGEAVRKAFDCLFALKLCFGLHTPQLFIFALQCFSKKNKRHKFWVLCKPYQEYNT